MSLEADGDSAAGSKIKELYFDILNCKGTKSAVDEDAIQDAEAKHSRKLNKRRAKELRKQQKKLTMQDQKFATGADSDDDIPFFMQDASIRAAQKEKYYIAKLEAKEAKLAAKKRKRKKKDSSSGSSSGSNSSSSEDKKKKKDKKKGKEVDAAPEISISAGVAGGPGRGTEYLGSAKEAREALLREAAKEGFVAALPGSTPEVKGDARFNSAKERLEKLQAMQQKREKRVEYSVRKPNF